MHLNLRKRIVVAAAAALLAPLLGASAAAATTGAHGRPPVKAGPTGTSIMAQIDLSIGGGGCCATAPAIAPAITPVKPALLGLPLNSALAGLQGRLATTMQRVQTTVQRTTDDADSKVRGLRTRVTSLRRKTVRTARKLQAQALAEARSTADGVWLVANSAGAIVAQSGNMAVSHVATGVYDVTTMSGGPICPALGMSVEVYVSDTSGAPMDGGFYMAAKGDTPATGDSPAGGDDNGD